MQQFGPGVYYNTLVEVPEHNLLFKCAHRALSPSYASSAVQQYREYAEPPFEHTD